MLNEWVGVTLISRRGRLGLYSFFVPRNLGTRYTVRGFMFDSEKSVDRGECHRPDSLYQRLTSSRSDQ